MKIKHYNILQKRGQFDWEDYAQFKNFHDAMKAIKDIRWQNRDRTFRIVAFFGSD